MKKIVFFDIDGTIYTFNKGIPASTVEAIRLLKENGHIPVICTGRPKATVFPEITALGFDGMIAGAGTYIEYSDKVIYSKILDKKLLAETLKLFEHAGITSLLEGPEYVCYDKKQVKSDRFHVIERMIKEYPAAIRPMEPDKDQINKLTLYISNRDAFEKLIPKLQKKYTIIQYADSPFAELTPKGISKASGIERIIRHLGIPHENTYAFGDGPNDLKMLQYVQYGVAMGNSEKCVLDIAKYRTSDIWEDGVFQALRDFELI